MPTYEYYATPRLDFMAHARYSCDELLPTRRAAKQQQQQQKALQLFIKPVHSWAAIFFV